MRTPARTLFLILAVLVSWLGTPSTFSQGTVTFINDANSVVRYSSGPLASSGVTVSLYGGPAGAAESALTLAGTTTIIPGAPGFFNGGVVSIPGLAGGANATLQVRAWSGAASYAAALIMPGAFAGKSALWTQRTGGPVPNPPAAITAGFGGGLNAPIILFTNVPEPSTWALALVAGGILVAARRLEQN